MEDNNLNHLTSDWGTKGNNTSTRSWGKSAVLRSWGAETVEKRSHSEDITVVKTWGEVGEKVVSEPAKNQVSVLSRQKHHVDTRRNIVRET